MRLRTSSLVYGDRCSSCSCCSLPHICGRNSAYTVVFNNGSGQCVVGLVNSPTAKDERRSLHPAMLRPANSLLNLPRSIADLPLRFGRFSCGLWVMLHARPEIDQALIALIFKA